MKNNIIWISMILGLTLIFNISPATAADLPDLSLEKNVVSPSSITQGATATLTIEVKNIGKAKNRAVTLFLHGDEKALQAFGIPMYNSAEHGVSMPELAAGQVFTYTSTKVIKLSSGNYTIRAIIWPGNKPMSAAPMSNSEGNLTNNEKEVQFTVKQASFKPSNLGPKHKIPANPSNTGVIN